MCSIILMIAKLKLFSIHVVSANTYLLQMFFNILRRIESNVDELYIMIYISRFSIKNSIAFQYDSFQRSVPIEIPIWN